MRYRFADCVLHTERYVIHRDGRFIQLSPKVFQVLLYLLENRGRVVSKQELADQVWPTYVVSDAALESCVKRARQAVGDTGRSQRIIQTRQGHGYCFVATVVEPDQRVLTPEMNADPADLCDQVRQHTPDYSVVPAPAIDEMRSSGARGASTAVAACPPGLPDLWSQEVGEYKIATLLCATWAAGSASSSRATLDTLHSHLQILCDIVRDTVQPYGGRLLPVLGESLLVMFGAPEAQEDHAHRAVLSAWALFQRLHSQPATPSQDTSQPGCADGLAVCLSLHTGVVAVGGMGDDREPQTGVIGDTVSLALALHQRAAPGMILCSETTARLVRDIARLQAVEPTYLPEPVASVRLYTISRLERPRTSRWRQRAHVHTPFIGRTRELAVLHGLWEQVRRGQGQVVSIVGEPGIGKSRLVSEFRRCLQGCPHTYLAGRCPSYGQTTPYRLVVSLLRYACGLSDTDTPETITTRISRLLGMVGRDGTVETAYLLHLLGLPAGTTGVEHLTSEEWQALTFNLLGQIATRASQRRTLILEVEDVHWIDATSEVGLTTLVERLMGVPLLLLMTARSGYCPPWMGKSYATQLALTPLTPDDSQRMVRGLLTRPGIPETRMRDMVRKADGNPFFIEELARAEMARHAHTKVADVPETIQTVLMARIDQLPLPEKRLLQVAAVIGSGVPVALLQAVSGLSQEALQRRLNRLQATEFLYETHCQAISIYTFKHSLIQDVAYWSLLTKTRQQYHLQVARVLERQFPDAAIAPRERLAHHYAAAACYEQAAIYWHRAGQCAVERWANVEAAAHVSRGLEALMQLPQTAARARHELTLQLLLGQALRAAQGPAAPEVERAYVRARLLCHQVVETSAYVQVLRGLRGVYFSRPEFHKARELGEHCLRLAQQIQQPDALAEAHYALGITLFCLGDVRSAQAHLQQAMIPGSEVELKSRAFTAYTLWLLGYPDQAQRWSDEALALAQASTSPITLAAVLGITARFHLQCRDIHGVHTRAEALIQLATTQDFAYWLAQGMLLQGWALAAQGQAEAGLTRLQQGLAACQGTGAEVSRPYYLACLAEAYVMSRQPREALAVLHEALKIAQTQGQRLDQARLYWLRGTLLAGDNAVRLSPANRQIGVVAEASLRRALTIARQQCAKSWELRAAISLARLWQGQKKRAAGRQLLVEVYPWFTEGFATPDLQEAKTLLEERL